MNLTHSLSEALFALPIERVKERPAEFDPSIIAREELVDGRRMVVAMRKRADGYYRISAEDWAMLRLFDGQNVNVRREFVIELTAQGFRVQFFRLAQLRRDSS